ncbi:hypothetical protein ACFFF5_03020 [Lederbergia wuyishanensis]|uniref:SLH domain-containing protein n=1 Tax=Lederbergia wuyishanensis TaxID=1347903 RepID=A0ABU0D089_9BACI|nr:hypothetical protein [Lederbergia wuyishanensis]MCJ8006446.1 hypothetical protein [Lederbergia wuyishanensis]MDQ0341821.1 hypothetical protein [Lederbergia wuyishanensis]
MSISKEEIIENMIAKLNVTSLSDREAVTYARQAYIRLSDEQKAAITNIELLDKAEAQILSHWIDSIGEVTSAAGGLIYVILEQYHNLNEVQQSFVTNIDRIESIKAQLETIQSIKQENFKKAVEVQKIIDRMDIVDAEVTLARDAYEELSSDQKSMVGNYLELKEAENKLSRQPVHQTPSNIAYAGTRSSIYGIRGEWLGIQDWQHITDKMDGYFPGAQPTYVWIVGKLDTEVGIGGTHLEFEAPNDGIDYASQNISFGDPTKPGHLSHEDYLNYFDEQGIKVYLQVESGFADMKTLMDLIFAKYGHHKSVIGFGVDVEWYYGITEDAGIPVTDAIAKEWNDHLKSINPNYRMFLKHYNYCWLPPTYRSDLLFCNDSQGLGSLDGEVQPGFLPEFKAWADHFYPNEVLYQIGYSPDATWYYAEDTPIIQKLGEGLAEVTRQKLGIAWVDFTIKDPMTFPDLFKSDSELVGSVNSALRYLLDTPFSRVGTRFNNNKATVTDALYIARLREIINLLTDDQHSQLNQEYISTLMQFETKAIETRIENLYSNNLKLKDKEKIALVRSAYSALTEEQKSKISNIEKLFILEKDIIALETVI